MTLLDIKKVVYAVRLELKFHLSPRMNRCTVSLSVLLSICLNRDKWTRPHYLSSGKIVCYQTHVEMAGSFTWETS